MDRRGYRRVGMILGMETEIGGLGLGLRKLEVEKRDRRRRGIGHSLLKTLTTKRRLLMRKKRGMRLLWAGGRGECARTNDGLVHGLRYTIYPSSSDLQE